MEAEQEKRTGLSRDAIKLFAIFTMTLNHLAQLIDFGDCISRIMLYAGYFTAVTMICFLVEGYGYTKNKLKYGIRLFVFAVMAQFPFSLAFSGYETISFVSFNMFFTLFLCFLLLVVHEKIQTLWIKIFLYIGIITLTYFCDWPITSGVGTLLFIWAGKNDTKKFVAYLLFCLFHFSFTFFNYSIQGFFLEGLIAAGLGCIAPLLSCLCVCCFYNGRRANHGRDFLKWFFYAYYPAHLLLLGIFRLAVLYMRGVI